MILQRVRFISASLKSGARILCIPSFQRTTQCPGVCHQTDNSMKDINERYHLIEYGLEGDQYVRNECSPRPPFHRRKEGSVLKTKMVKRKKDMSQGYLDEITGQIRLDIKTKIKLEAGDDYEDEAPNFILNQSVKLLKCHKCDHTTKYPSGLARHHKRKHTYREYKPYSCSDCDFSTKTKEQLNLHRKRLTSSKPVQCKICDYKTKFKCELLKHQLMHDEGKPYKCQMCDTSFRHQSEMFRHQIIHSLEKPFRCSYCEFSTKRRNTLIDHESIHTGSKRFKCHNCGYSTTRNCYLMIWGHGSDSVKSSKSKQSTAISSFSQSHTATFDPPWISLRIKREI
ncbi:Zinc finger protein 565 [Eumeta japonica]|uniref:Zinc finger protein 565 n=1 Tax=Eumeta variegata TaxID=151549 RepID=A0A4C1U1H6_EUMVA|nr:Zinc finger protein 565 [Eumeta japonica]